MISLSNLLISNAYAEGAAPAAGGGIGIADLGCTDFLPFAVCGATFMLLVDLMVVQVSLPTIQREYGASICLVFW